MKLDQQYAIDSVSLAAAVSRACSQAGGAAADAPTAEDWAELAEKVEAHAAECAVDETALPWKTLASTLRVAECFLLQERAGQGTVEPQAARERLMVLRAQLLRGQDDDPALPFAAEVAALVTPDGVAAGSITQLVAPIGRADLPTTYYRRTDRDRDASQPVPSGAAPSSQPQVIRLIAFVDGVPLTSPQIVRPQLSYSLRFEVRGLGWPQEASGLRLHALTSTPEDAYSISEFRLGRGGAETTLRGRIDGELLFLASQSVLSDPFLFSLSGEWTTEGSEPLPPPEIIGHNRLSFRAASDDDPILASGYRRLDEHVAGLLRDLVRTEPKVKDELTELVPVLDALTNLHGVFAQTGVFKAGQVVAERDFQKEALRALRHRLGEEVQEHTAQAGGITDIRYKGVVTELKVERENGDREAIAKKYGSQTTQYQGVEARKVGAVLVLDMTEKVLPPGDIRNDILLHRVETHGGLADDPSLSSWVFVFVVNGNLRRPSDYSRRASGR